MEPHGHHVFDIISSIIVAHCTFCVSVSFLLWLVNFQVGSLSLIPVGHTHEAVDRRFRILWLLNGPPRAKTAAEEAQEAAAVAVEMEKEEEEDELPELEEI